MKQSETKCFTFGTGAGVIRELSNNPLIKRPQLTLMIPKWDGDKDYPAIPAQSLEASAHQVIELYAALKDYFEEATHER